MDCVPKANNRDRRLAAGASDIGRVGLAGTIGIRLDLDRPIEWLTVGGHQHVTQDSAQRAHACWHQALQVEAIHAAWRALPRSSGTPPSLGTALNERQSTPKSMNLWQLLHSLCGSAALIEITL